jgi:hypothetical protein
VKAKKWSLRLKQCHLELTQCHLKVVRSELRFEKSDVEVERSDLEVVQSGFLAERSDLAVEQRGSQRVQRDRRSRRSHSEREILQPPALSGGPGPLARSGWQALRRYVGRADFSRRRSASLASPQETSVTSSEVEKCYKLDRIRLSLGRPGTGLDGACPEGFRASTRLADCMRSIQQNAACVLVSQFLHLAQQSAHRSAGFLSDTHNQISMTFHNSPLHRPDRFCSGASLARARYDIRTVQELLGHKPVRTTLIYCARTEPWRTGCEEPARYSSGNEKWHAMPKPYNAR